MRSGKWLATSVEFAATTKSEIKQVSFDPKGNVDQIDTVDGRTLYPVASPSTGEWASLLVPPICGFFGVWIFLRVVGWLISWIYTGFRASET